MKKSLFLIFFGLSFISIGQTQQTTPEKNQPASSPSNVQQTSKVSKIDKRVKTTRPKVVAVPARKQEAIKKD